MGAIQALALFSFLYIKEVEALYGEGMKSNEIVRLATAFSFKQT